MKRLIVALLILFNISGYVNISVSAEELSGIDLQDNIVVEENILSENTAKRYDFLKSIGIIGELDEYVTRGEFASIIADAFMWDKTLSLVGSQIIFSDIGIYHYLAPKLEFLYANGIIAGRTDGTFGNDENIYFSDALRIVLNALGYGIRVESENMNEASIIALSQSLGVLDNVTSGTNKLLTKSQCIDIVFNMLFAEVLESNYGSKDITLVKSNACFYEAIMGLYHDVGVVDGIGEYSLFGKEFREDEISINENKFKLRTGISIDVELLGFEIEFFCKDDTLVGYFCGKNDVKEIRSYDIETYDSRSIKFYDENNRERNVKISNNADIFYNYYVTNDFSKIISKNGFVKLIDNNSDNFYDVVKVYDGNSFVVSSIIDSGEKIIALKNPINQKSQTIDFDNYDNYRIFNDVGIECDVDAVNPGDIITIFENADNIVTVHISNKTVSGKITEYYQSGNENYIVVNDTDYIINENCFADSYKIGTTGVNAVLYLDKMDKVAKIEVKVDEGWELAYMMGIVQEKGIENSVMLKLLFSNDTIGIITLPSKVTIDGQPYTDEEKIYNYLKNSDRVLRCFFDNENLIKIDTAEICPLIENSGNNILDEDNLLLLRVNAYLHYSRSAKSFQRESMFYEDNEIDGEIYPKDTAPIFFVPQQDNANEDLYKCASLSAVSPGYKPYVKGYYFGMEDYLAECVVVCQEASSSVSYDTAMSVITNISLKSSSDDEVKTALELMTQGVKATYLVSESLRAEEISTLKEGDIIRFNTDTNGEVEFVEKIYTSYGDGLTQQNEKGCVIADGMSAEFGANGRIMLCIPKQNRNDMLIVERKDGDYTQLYDASKFKITVVDTTQRSDESKFYTGDVWDINTEEFYPDKTDKLLIHTVSSVPREIIVIK